MARFKCGDSVKVIGNSSGHGLATGTVSAITKIQGSNQLEPQYVLGRYNCWCHGRDLQLLVIDKDRLLEEKKQLEKELATANSKIEFMTVNKLETFDQNEYKVWAAIQTLNSKATDIEKAKTIAKLIGGE